MGEIDWARYNISRSASKSALRLAIQVDKRIEDMIKSMAEAQGYPTPIDIASYGKLWYGDGKTPIKIWQGVEFSSPSYTFDSICGPMTIPRKGAVEQVNLSFLRIEGVSNPEGVVMYVNFPYNIDDLKTMYKSIMLATRQFVRDYLVDVNIAVKVFAQEG